MIKIINGSLIKSDAQYICHQCNLVTDHAAGIAQLIFNTFPYADIYAPRKKIAIRPSPDEIPGDIVIKGNGKDQRYIINMLCQVYPGRPKYPDSKRDGYAAREHYFELALEKITKIENLKSIAFPFKIGCNLAGGNWNNYLNMLEAFSSKVQAEVYIFKPEE